MKNDVTVLQAEVLGGIALALDPTLEPSSPEARDPVLQLTGYTFLQFPYEFRAQLAWRLGRRPATALDVVARVGHPDLTDSTMDVIDVATQDLKVLTLPEIREVTNRETLSGALMVTGSDGVKYEIAGSASGTAWYVTPSTPLARDAVRQITSEFGLVLSEGAAGILSAASGLSDLWHLDFP